mgnify:CR=1 FL=1
MGTQNKAVKDIIARIGQIRSEAGLSSRELSLRIGKNESYVHSMEGKYGFEPSLSALLDMIEVCGKTPEEFFYHDPAQAGYGAVAAFQKADARTESGDSDVGGKVSGVIRGDFYERRGKARECFRARLA